MKEINILEKNLNPFSEIGKKWFLLAAGDEAEHNMMTASWGFMGVMWNKNCVQAVVRPNRFTYELLGKNTEFSVNFLPEKYREALTFCGTHSGRNCDKIAETKLTPVYSDGTMYFKEADMVLVCHTLYSQQMNPVALDKDINDAFNQKEPIHCQIIGEIIKAYSQK